MKPKVKPAGNNYQRGKTWKAAEQLAEKLAQVLDEQPNRNLYIDMLATLSVAGTVLNVALKKYAGQMPDDLLTLEHLIEMAVFNLGHASFQAEEDQRTGATKPNPTPPTVH
jgi:hypothetical protein